jgi:hypothetical protein
MTQPVPVGVAGDKALSSHVAAAGLIPADVMRARKDANSDIPISIATLGKE